MQLRYTPEVTRAFFVCIVYIVRYGTLYNTFLLPETVFPKMSRDFGPFTLPPKLTRLEALPLAYYTTARKSNTDPLSSDTL